MSVTVLGVPAREATPLEGDLTFETLPGRDLDQAELRSLASSIAQRPELWQHHLAFDDDHRVYVSLYRDAHVDVWLLCWTPENDTGFHDHDISSGAVAVVSGTLCEHNLAIDNETIETLVDGGNVFSFGPDHIHRLTGALARLGLGARLQPAAVADGPVLRRPRRPPPPAVRLLRRRAATAGLEGRAPSDAPRRVQGDMRIFFTGGSGKAGRHVAPYLAEQGHQVTNADLVALDHPAVADLRVDLTDAGETYSAIAGLATFAELDLPETPSYDAVVHFAAVPRILLTSDATTYADERAQHLQPAGGRDPARGAEDRLRLVGDDVRDLLRPG